MPKKKWYASFANKIKVYIVDGKYVRENQEIDFTQGGNSGKYEFIPKEEIWIDDGLNEDEILPTLLHEVIEYKLMDGGYDYDFAHDIASDVELAYRKLDDYEMMIDKIEEVCNSLGDRNDQKS
jgi:hypothetical protein